MVELFLNHPADTREIYVTLSRPLFFTGIKFEAVLQIRRHAENMET